MLDAALNKRMIRLQDVPVAHADYVDAASQSPMETRLRLLLVLAGLPRPQVQVSVGDENSFLGRADLYYPDHRLIIEYDGGTHRDSFASDNRRQNRLLDAGYRMLRFSAGDVYGPPNEVVDLVRSALAEPVAAPLSGLGARPGPSAPHPGPAARQAAGSPPPAPPP